MRAQGSTAFTNHAVRVVTANGRQALTARDKQSSHLRHKYPSPPRSADLAPTGSPTRLFPSPVRARSRRPRPRAYPRTHRWRHLSGDADEPAERRTGSSAQASLPKRALARDRRSRFSTIPTLLPPKTGRHLSSSDATVHHTRHVSSQQNSHRTPLHTKVRHTMPPSRCSPHKPANTLQWFQVSRGWAAQQVGRPGGSCSRSRRTPGSRHDATPTPSSRRQQERPRPLRLPEGSRRSRRRQIPPPPGFRGRFGRRSSRTVGCRPAGRSSNWSSSSTNRARPRRWFSRPSSLSVAVVTGVAPGCIRLQVSLSPSSLNDSRT